MNNFRKITYIIFMLYLLLMTASLGYSGEVSKPVRYRADFGLYSGIKKEYSIPKDSPVYLFFKFVLSPGYIAADLAGKVTFDQDNQTITINGTGGEFLTTGGIILNGNIVLDFEITPLGLTISETLLIPKFPQINKGWDDSVKFNSLLLNGKTAELEAGIRKLVSVQLSAVDIAKLILDAATSGATTTVPQSVINAIKEWADGGLQLNGGLTSDLALSGEAISMNGSRIVREGQSISAPGLDLSQNSYEVTSDYVEDFTYNLNFVVSSDFYVTLDPPLLGPIWSKEFEIVAATIEIVSERQGNLDFSTTPNPIVFPIQGTPTNQAPQTAGTIAARSLTAGGSATTVDVSSYFSDPDNDNLTYSTVSNNRGVATVAASGSQVTIMPSSAGSAEIIVRATDPGGSTATQRFTVTVQAAQSCTYTLSQSSQSAPAAGESISVNVITPVGCPWSAWSNSIFLSVSPSSGTGSGTVTVRADQHTGGSSRTGNVTIAGKTFTVNQSSSSTPVVQTDLAIQSLQLTKTTVTTGEAVTLQITVNNNGPGDAQNIGISYYHSSIQGLSSQDQVQWQGTIWVDSLAANTSVTPSIPLLAPPTAGTYYYGAWLTGVSDDTNTNNDVATEVGLTVSSSTGCFYSLGTTSRDASADGESFSVSVTATTGCDWTARSNSLFLFVNPSSGTGSGTVTVTVAENTRVSNRTGSVTIADKTFTVTQASQSTFATRADLEIRAFEVSKSTLTTGESFTLSVTVHNNGPGNSVPIDISYYYSFILGPSTEDRVVRQRTVEADAIAPGKSITKSITLQAPSTPGTYYYGAWLAGATNDPNIYNDLATEVGVTVSDSTPDPPPDSPSIYDVCERTPQVRDAIVKASPVRNCADVTEDHLDSITRLSLYSDDITTLQQRDFDELRSLEYLNLSNNNLKLLPAEVFWFLTKLTKLDLADNQLTVLEARTFARLSRLEELYLDGNQLTTLQRKVFDNLDNLIYLNLRKNQLTTLEAKVFEDLSHLEELDLHENQLTTLPVGVFNGLNNLTELRLYENQLATLPAGVFNGLNNLTELDLEDNSLTTLPTDVFKGLTSLEDLDLEGNPLTTIETGAFNGLSNFTELDLRGYSLTTIEVGAFNGLNNLTELDLDGNQLTTLPVGVFDGLNNLTELDLDENQLTTLPTDVFKGLTSLEDLDLYENQLTTLPVGVFDGLNNLTGLDLHENQLTTLPVGVFDGLNNLTGLDLDGNQLTTLPVGVFDGLNNLTGLDLDGNQLTTLPAGVFNGLNSLTRLNLEENQLTTLPTDLFKGLNSLTHLDLEENQLTTLPTDLFKGLNSLIRLDLKDNPGDPFTLTLELARTDNMDLTASSPASVVVKLVQGAPFDMSVSLSVQGGTLSATTATITRGQTQSAPITVTKSGSGSTTVSLGTAPTVPSGYPGIQMAVGNSLVLFGTGSNRAPLAVGTISTETLTVGGSAASVDVSSNFQDPDNDNLTYTATSDNTGMASVSVSGALVTIAPNSAGSATITVTASDGTLTATQDIAVTVQAAPRTAQTLVKISGDNQQGAPGAALTNPFVVEVRDAANSGLGGINVMFAIIAGGGTLSTQTAPTDANGQASTTLTLGPNAGTNTVEASATGISGSVRFTATAETQVSNVVNIPGANLRAAIESTLGKASGATITPAEMATLTRLDAANANIRVLTGLEGATNLTSLNLANNIIEDLSPLVANTGLGNGDEIDVRGNPLSDTSINTHIPTLQSRGVTVNFETDVNRAPEPVGTIPAQPLIVDGRDATVNVSANFRDPDNDSLTYTATSDNTAVATVSISGAIVTITPESVGSATVTVTASDGTVTATQDIAVTVEAAPRVAHALEKISGDNQQGPPGEPLLSPFIVEVRDTENRGLEGIDVTFTVTAGGGLLSERTVTTGPNGQASSKLTLGNDEGENTVSVSAEGISQTVSFTAVGANAINIPDRYLRAKIERALNKRAGDPITAAEMATLTRLNASNSSISDLTGLKFAINLTELNLYDNNIRILPAGVFVGLSKVTTLYLQRNPLKTIKTGAFSGLSSLTKLDLSSVYTNTRADITTIEPGAFNGLSNLTELNLYYNRINILRTGVFAGLSKVTKLHLRRNPLTTIKTGAFSGLSSLTKLDLSSVYTNTRADITTIEPGAFNGLSSLTELNLYYNRINILRTGVFAGLSKVTTLYLQRNPLTTIKTGAFSGLSSLTKLDLSSVYTNTRADITTIEPGAFNGLSNLTELNLYYNRIKTLPTDAFKGLNKVTKLHLRRNPLTTIKTGAFSGLSSLTKLDLSSVYTNTRADITTIEPGAFNGLSNLTELNLYYNRIKTLPTDAFKGLNKVTKLHLRRNPLTTIKTGAFSGLSSLTKLDLSSVYTNTRADITTIEPGAFNGLSNLTELNLYYNRINILRTGVFEGLTSLTSLNLNRNPGTPFTLTLELARTDTTDHAAPGPATVVAQLAQGAPFEMTVNLSVEGGTLSANTVTIARAKIQSEPITLTQSGIRPATVSLETVPRVPSNYYGIRLAVGDSLSTGSISPHALEIISGDNQQGHAGATLENPLIVEVRDAVDRGLEGVDVTFAVTAGDGSLSETTVTTNANSQAESWLTLGSQPGTNTVHASVEGLSQTAVFNAVIESMEFDLSMLSGTSLIHVPLKVTAVDGVAQSIESIADLYNALGGASTVNFLVTYDPATQGWLSYFGASDTGTSADKRLADDTGILAGMKARVFIRLQGDALGTNGSSTLTLNQGLNLVGLPLRDPRIDRVSDLLALEGLGGNVPVVILTDNGEFKVVGQPGDPSDIPITGGQSFILTAQKTVTVGISGDGWTNVSGGVAAPLVRGADLTGIQVTNTTLVLALRGSIVDEVTGANRTGFRVIVKNLSAPPDSTISRAVARVTGAERNGYQLTVVDVEAGRAAMIGDLLEISAQSPDPLIGVQPLRYTITAEDVKRSRIQLPELVAYEIPAEPQLLPNYPNPFNPETWIPYRLAEDAFVTLAIYDGSGRVIRTLEVGHRVAAVYESRSKAIYWDGRNEFGERVASGVYFYHLSAGDYSATKRMVIVK